VEELLELLFLGVLAHWRDMRRQKNCIKLVSHAKGKLAPACLSPSQSLI
jgi:hypothetical protein